MKMKNEIGEAKLSTKIPHPRAEFLGEALQDTSRKIEGKHTNGDFWCEVTLSFVLTSNSSWEFRFEDTVKKIESSLTDNELYAVVAKHNPDKEDVNYAIIKAVANAAAERQHKDMAHQI